MGLTPPRSKPLVRKRPRVLAQGSERCSSTGLSEKTDPPPGEVILSYPSREYSQPRRTLPIKRACPTSPSSVSLLPPPLSPRPTRGPARKEDSTLRRSSL